MNKTISASVMLTDLPESLPVDRAFFSVPQAAAILKVSTWTLYERIRQGKIKAEQTEFAIGKNSTVITAPNLAELLDERRAQLLIRQRG